MVLSACRNLLACSDDDTVKAFIQRVLGNADLWESPHEAADRVISHLETILTRISALRRSERVSLWQPRN
jgi:hypothetical protein